MSSPSSREATCHSLPVRRLHAIVIQSGGYMPSSYSQEATCQQSVVFARRYAARAQWRWWGPRILAATGPEQIKLSAQDQWLPE